MTKPDHAKQRSATSSAQSKPMVHGVSTAYPASPPLEEQLEWFWDAGPELDGVSVRIEPPADSLELLKTLGPSPFAGTFPVLGFLETTYDKVSRYALERSADTPRSAGRGGNGE